MSFRRFFLYSAIGGVLWATGVTLLGFWLGRVDFVANNIELMLIVIVAISLLPILVEWLRNRRSQPA